MRPPQARFFLFLTRNSRLPPWAIEHDTAAVPPATNQDRRFLAGGEFLKVSDVE